jgi:hypothetical protein
MSASAGSVPAWLATTSPRRRGQVLDAVRRHPPVVAVQRPHQRHQQVGREVLVEPELVDVVVAGEPAPQERQPASRSWSARASRRRLLQRPEPSIAMPQPRRRPPDDPLVGVVVASPDAAWALAQAPVAGPTGRRSGSPSAVRRAGAAPVAAVGGPGDRSRSATDVGRRWPPGRGVRARRGPRHSGTVRPRSCGTGGRRRSTPAHRARSERHRRPRTGPARARRALLRDRDHLGVLFHQLTPVTLAREEALLALALQEVVQLALPADDLLAGDAPGCPRRRTKSSKASRVEKRG